MRAILSLPQLVSTCWSLLTIWFWFPDLIMSVLFQSFSKFGFVCSDFGPKKNSNTYFNILTHYQTTNFRLFQTERVCRPQFQVWWKWHKVIQMGRKHCGKMRNCLFSTCLDNFLPFSTYLKLLSANSFSLKESKICRLVMSNFSFSHSVFKRLQLPREGLRFPSFENKNAAIAAGNNVFRIPPCFPSFTRWICRLPSLSPFPTMLSIFYALNMQVTIIISFSHNVIYPFQNKFLFSWWIILSPANVSNLDQSKIHDSSLQG